MRPNTNEVISQIKKVREEKGFSFSKILSMMEENGDYMSKSTISRVFADGSEKMNFRYEETIRPIAKVLLDIENIEDDDSLDTKALKSLLKYKIERIEQLENENEQLKADLDKERLKAHEKFAKERQLMNDRIEFLTSQVALKDKRIDILLDALLKE